MASLQDALRGAVSDEQLTNLDEVLDFYVEGQNIETIAAPGALAPEAGYTDLQVHGTDAFTLADGTRLGQVKRIRCTAAANTPAGTLTPDNFTSGSTILFNAVDEQLGLVWDGSGWFAYMVVGATIS